MNRFYADKSKWAGRPYIGTKSAPEKMTPFFSFDGPEGSAVAKLKAAHIDAFAIGDDLRKQRETITSTGKYLPLGITEAVAKHAAEDSLPKLRRARAVVETVKADIAQRASKITLTPPDPTDVIGEAQRAELRARLANMTTQQRNEFVNKNRLDPALAAAIVHASPLLSGVDELTHRNMIAEQIQREHGDAMAELADLQEVVKVAEKAVTLGRDELREIIGVDRPTFEQIASVSEKNSGRLPFRVDREVISGQVVEIARVLDMEAKVWRRATDEEILASKQEAA